MDHPNPYSPPNANTLGNIGIAVGKPRVVSIAVTLLWLSFAAGTASTIAIRLSDPPPPIPEALLFALMAMGIALGALFIYQASQGRHWARVTLLVTTLFVTLVSAVSFFSHGGSLSPRGIIGLSISSVRLLAILLLFTVPSNIWFKQLRSQI